MLLFKKLFRKDNAELPAKPIGESTGGGAVPYPDTNAKKIASGEEALKQRKKNIIKADDIPDDSYPLW